jgi:hypothetical protein
MEQTTGGYEMIPGYLCLHYSSITVHYCVYSCFKFVFFSGNKVCVQVVWWKKHDSDRAFFTFGSDVMYTRVCQCIYIYIYKSIYLYIYIYICIYIYTSIHLYTHPFFGFGNCIYCICVDRLYDVNIIFSSLLTVQGRKRNFLGPPTSESDWGLLTCLGLRPTKNSDGHV